jgi:hypothetical protein
MSGVELPDGMTAWTVDGTPVRRVATTGNPIEGRPAATAPAWPELTDDVRWRIWSDVCLYGDAWVDLNGDRVDPTQVQVRS